MEMLNIGNHVSSSKGYLAMGKEITSINGNVFAFFTRNPRGGKAKDINESDVKKFLEYKKEHNIGTLVAHAPYTLNPCAAKPELREFAHDVMADDLVRMEYTPGNLYNFHPGAHTGQGIETGIKQIAEALNQLMKPDMNTTVLLETMAGKGSEVGGTFEELAEIIEHVECKEKMENSS